VASFITNCAGSNSAPIINILFLKTRPSYQHVLDVGLSLLICSEPSLSNLILNEFTGWVWVYPSMAV